MTTSKSSCTNSKAIRFAESASSPVPIIRETLKLGIICAIAEARLACPTLTQRQSLLLLVSAYRRRNGGRGIARHHLRELAEILFPHKASTTSEEDVA